MKAVSAPLWSWAFAEPSESLVGWKEAAHQLATFRRNFV